MTKASEHKTNAMRVLDAVGIAYRSYHFDADATMSGVEVANIMGHDPDRVFKTLVTQGKTGNYYVFLIPVACELDLKKAAHAVGEKSIVMIKAKELFPLTSYVHGGCSPLAMKKNFTTTIDETAELFDEIIFSAGRVGSQIEVSPEELSRVLEFTVADLTV